MLIRLSSLLGACALVFAGAAHAQIPISLASSNGNSSTQTATYGITPSGGQTNEFLLTTINPAASLPANGSLGTTPATTNVTTLNTYFGLPAGTLAGFNAQDGSGYLSQQVTLLAGAVVRFDYIFLTNEDNTLPTTPAPSQFHNDRAFFTVNGALNSTIYQASNLSVAQLNAGSASPNFNFQSAGAAGNGYTTVTYTVPTTGNYTFGFGVIDVDTNTVYSGLLIDNFPVQRRARTAHQRPARLRDSGGRAGRVASCASRMTRDAVLPSVRGVLTPGYPVVCVSVSRLTEASPE